MGLMDKASDFMGDTKDDAAKNMEESFDERSDETGMGMDEADDVA